MGSPGTATTSTWAETNRGIRVFDLRNIFDLGSRSTARPAIASAIGLHGKRYYGAGNRYVLPQLTYYDNAAGAPAKCSGATASHGRYWFTRRVALPPRRRNRGRLVSGEWTAGGVQRNREDVAISKGPEDLLCWRSTSRLWTVAEHPGDRALYGIADSRCR